MRRVVSEDDIRNAIFSPPETTRAFFRGRSVARFNDQIESIQWDEVVFANSSQAERIALPEPVVDDRLRQLNAAVRGSADFNTFARVLNQF